jgi:hypothetical protein
MGKDTSAYIYYGILLPSDQTLSNLPLGIKCMKINEGELLVYIARLGGSGWYTGNRHTSYRTFASDQLIIDNDDIALFEQCGLDPILAKWHLYAESS